MEEGESQKTAEQRLSEYQARLRRKRFSYRLSLFPSKLLTQASELYDSENFVLAAARLMDAIEMTPDIAVTIEEAYFLYSCLTTSQEDCIESTLSYNDMPHGTKGRNAGIYTSLCKDMADVSRRFEHFAWQEMPGLRDGGGSTGKEQASLTTQGVLLNCVFAQTLSLDIRLVGSPFLHYRVNILNGGKELFDDAYRWAESRKPSWEYAKVMECCARHYGLYSDVPAKGLDIIENTLKTLKEFKVLLVSGKFVAFPTASADEWCPDTEDVLEGLLKCHASIVRRITYEREHSGGNFRHNLNWIEPTMDLKEVQQQTPDNSVSLIPLKQSSPGFVIPDTGRDALSTKSPLHFGLGGTGLEIPSLIKDPSRFMPDRNKRRFVDASEECLPKSGRATSPLVNIGDINIPVVQVTTEWCSTKGGSDFSVEKESQASECKSATAASVAATALDALSLEGLSDIVLEDLDDPGSLWKGDSKTEFEAGPLRQSPEGNDCAKSLHRSPITLRLPPSVAPVRSVDASEDYLGPLRLSPEGTEYTKSLHRSPIPLRLPQSIVPGCSVGASEEYLLKSVRATSSRVNFKLRDNSPIQDPVERLSRVDRRVLGSSKKDDRPVTASTSATARTPGLGTLRLECLTNALAIANIDFETLKKDGHANTTADIATKEATVVRGRLGVADFAKSLENTIRLLSAARPQQTADTPTVRKHIDTTSERKKGQQGASADMSECNSDTKEKKANELPKDKTTTEAFSPPQITTSSPSSSTEDYSSCGSMSSILVSDDEESSEISAGAQEGNKEAFPELAAIAGEHFQGT